MTEQQMRQLQNRLTVARRWRAFLAIVSVLGVILTGYLYFSQESNDWIVAAIVVLSQWISIGLNTRTLRSLEKLSAPK